jgi:hypothetical protein
MPSVAPRVATCIGVRQAIAGRRSVLASSTFTQRPHHRMPSGQQALALLVRRIAALHRVISIHVRRRLASSGGVEALPAGAPAVPGSQERNVREFLLDTRFPLSADRLKGFPIASIARLVLVDVKRGTRIGPLAGVLGRPGLEVHIYDHHPAHPKDIAGGLEVLREVGATTTILVGLLRDQEAAVTPQEATLFALGIYEETGFLTFTNTTEADFRAAAYCLSHGANLSLVADFIRRELTAEQVGLLNELIRSAETHTVNGVRVVLSTASSDRYVGDLASDPTNRDMEGINVLLHAGPDGQSVHVVHAAAGDGGCQPDRGALRGGNHATRPRRHRELASSGQAGAEPAARCSPLRGRGSWRPREGIPGGSIRGGGVMNRFNLAHLPVVRRGDMVGLITREVVDKAMFHGLGDAAVHEYMTGVHGRRAPSGVQRLMVGGLGLCRGEGAALRAVCGGPAPSHTDLLTRPTFDVRPKPAGPAVTASPTSSPTTYRARGGAPALGRCGGGRDQARIYTVGDRPGSCCRNLGGPGGQGTGSRSRNDSTCFGPW